MSHLNVWVPVGTRCTTADQTESAWGGHEVNQTHFNSHYSFFKKGTASIQHCRSRAFKRRWLRIKQNKVHEWLISSLDGKRNLQHKKVKPVKNEWVLKGTQEGWILCGRSRCHCRSVRSTSVSCIVKSNLVSAFNPQQLYSPFRDDTFFFRVASIS